MMAFLPLLLLALVSALAVYDHRTQRVPNAATLPLLLAGLATGWPGSPETWLGCLLLLTAWRVGALGGGDAKLWMALLWLAPALSASITAGTGPLVMAACLAGSTLGQVLYRAARRQPLVGQLGPGAWRAVPFAVWLLAAS